MRFVGNPRSLALIFVAVVAAGCGGGREKTAMPWTMYQRTTAHDAVVSAPFPAESWALDLKSKINGGLGYDGKRLYADDFAGEAVAIDPQSGHVLWRARGDDVLMSTPIVADGMVFVGSGTNAVLVDQPGKTVWGRKAGNHWYAFRSDDGKPVWSYATVGEAMPTAAYADGLLTFGTGDALATGLQANSGKLLWSSPLPGHVSMASAMIDGDLAYYVVTKSEADHHQAGGNQVVALHWRDGSFAWRAPYGNSDCTPTIAGGTLFVEGVQDGVLGPREAIGTNDVVALDARTGKLRWRYAGAPGVFTAVGTNERAIAGTYDGGVLYQSLPTTSQLAAFRAGDGHVLWMLRTAGPVKMSPLVRDGIVYVGDTAGLFYTISARTGAVRHVTEFRQPFTSAPPLVVGQTLFVPNSQTIRAIPLDKL